MWGQLAADLARFWSLSPLALLDLWLEEFVFLAHHGARIAQREAKR